MFSDTESLDRVLGEMAELEAEARERRPELDLLGVPRMSWHGRVPEIPADARPRVLATAGGGRLMWAHHGMVPGGPPDALAAFASVADARWFLKITGAQSIFRPLEVDEAGMLRECRRASGDGLRWLLVPRPKPGDRLSAVALWLGDVIRELGRWS